MCVCVGVGACSVGGMYMCVVCVFVCDLPEKEESGINR